MNRVFVIRQIMPGEAGIAAHNAAIRRFPRRPFELDGNLLEQREDSLRAFACVGRNENDGRVGQELEIVAQTLAPGEIVVADDGSDDGTEELVDSFAERYADVMPIRYVRLATRSGVVAARTEGIAHARGAWIANCDSDDTWLPTKLERQVEFLGSWSGERRLVLLGTFGYNVNEAEEVISLYA